MSLGEMSLTCMAPSQEYQGETGNAASMVLWMEWKNLEMLLTGDVEGEGEVQLTEWMRAHGKTKERFCVTLENMRGTDEYAQFIENMKALA